MTTTTEYGTWCNRVSTFSTSPDADVADFVSGGDADWREMIEETGAFQAMCAEHRDAINAALPASITLCGDQFIGPAYPADDEFDGYPVDERGGLDFKAMVEDIDLSPIVERNEPLTLEDIGRDVMKSQAKDPAKVASKAMHRLRVRPFAYRPHPVSKRPQALFRAGDVSDALSARPGQGARASISRTGK